MKVLAIDPGYDRLGVAVIDNKDKYEILLHSDCIETDKSAALGDRLRQIGTAFEKLIENYKPDIFGIETLFFNKNVKTAIGVAASRGVVIYLASKKNIPVVEVSPQQVKVAVTGYGKSDKKAVTIMVKQLVKNVPQSALDDEYDAIAVGVTALAHHK
ncbi:crossover junction endodeoxyribonuclease RuvC [bacterium]|nr:crossover junction endodeoxyribonuclease RuvC [bacterium]